MQWHSLPRCVVALAVLQVAAAVRAQDAAATDATPAAQAAARQPCAFAARERIPAGTTIRFVEPAEWPRAFAPAAPGAAVRTFEWTALADFAAGEIVPIDGEDSPRWQWSAASDRRVEYVVALDESPGALSGTARSGARSAAPPLAPASAGGAAPSALAQRSGPPDADVAPFVFTPTSTTVPGGQPGVPPIVPLSRCGVADVSCGGGTSVNGCTPTLTATGVPSATRSSGFTLTAAGMDGMRPAGMFYGLRLQPAQIGAGTSHFCDSSVHQRVRGAWSLSSGAPGSCDGSVTVDFNAELSSHPSWHGAPFAFGQVLYVQSYNRDPGNPSVSINVSDGLAVTLCY